MRWLFLFVLALNFAYIAWEMNKPSTDSYSNIKPIKNVPPIVLLSEVSQPSLVEMQQSLADEVSSKQEIPEQDDSVQADLDQANTEQAGAQQASAEQTDMEQIDTEQIDTENINTEQAGIDSSDIEQAGTEKAGIGKAGVELPGKDQAAPLKQLELTQAEKTEQAGSSVMETVSSSQKVLPAPAQQKNDSCYTLGPFRDLDILRGLTREIKSYVVNVDFRGSEVKEQPLYWVYIKPEKNRKKAIATGERLKAKKIKDYFIVREGEKINGVSLGYFRNKDGAQGLVKRVKKLGFNVTLERVYKTYTVYWLDYQVGGDVKVPETIFDKYLEADKKDKIKRQDRDCAL